MIAYLINAYPKVSHSFIRREIAALESRGLAVTRFSIRPPAELVDPDDLAESARTIVLLDGGIGRLVTATVRLFVRRPVAWLRTATLAVSTGLGSDRGLSRHLVYFAEACLLARRMAQHDIRHLHAHFGTNPADVAMYAGSLTGVPYSFTVHGPEEFDRPAALRLRRKIQRAQFVVAISSFGRSQLYRWAHYADWPKIHVVRCGLNAELFDGLHQPVPDTQQLVSIGRLCEQKGHPLLVRAVAELTNRGYNLRLVIVGDGELRPSLERLISDYGLENNVIITGWQSGEQVKAWLQSSRALVLASFAEGLPVVIMEALALGRPVIATMVAAIPELVTTDCGWLIPAGSVDDLAAAMAAVLDCPPDRLTAMGLSGIQRIRQRHNVEHEADRLARLLANPALEYVA